MDGTKHTENTVITLFWISGLNVILMLTGVESILLRNWATSQDSL
jgi:hypothetical protein